MKKKRLDVNYLYFLYIVTVQKISEKKRKSIWHSTPNSINHSSVSPEEKAPPIPIIKYVNQ